MSIGNPEKKKDPYADESLHLVRDLGLAAGLFLGVPAIGFGTYEYLRADVQPATVTVAMAADGLRADRIEIAHNGRSATAVLNLGSCSVKQVRVHLVRDGDVVTDTHGYEFSGYSLAQAYQERHKIAGPDKKEVAKVTDRDVEGTPKTFRFQNSDELQAQLGADPCYTLGVTRFLQTDD